MEDKNQIMFNPRTDHPGYEKDLLPSFERDGDEYRKMPGLHGLADNLKKKTKHSINPFIIPFCDDELVEKGTNVYTADDLEVVEDSGNFTNPFLDPPGGEILSGKEVELYTGEHGNSFRKAPGMDDLSGSKDSANGAENESANSTNPFLEPSCDDNLSLKEIELYTDKTVTECEMPLPELIVCFKEGSYSIVKDICIDEGNINTRDGTNQCVSELGEGNISTRDENVVSDDLKGHTRVLVEDCSIDSPYESCNIDGGEVRHDYDKVLPSVARDESLTMVSREKDGVENGLRVQECDNNNSSHESCDIDGNVTQRRQSNEDMSEDGESANSLSSSTTQEEDEPNNCNQVSEGETAGTVTLDSDSLPPPTTSGREEDPNTQESEFQRAVHPVNILGLEDPQTDSSRVFFIQHGHGESSFSSAGPFSGPLAYTDPVPYSGSISHRSDSSTTSTRSFAFPVLHSEWNSSPVRMVKPDRRHLRKHRGWKLCFPWCRY